MTSLYHYFRMIGCNDYVLTIFQADQMDPRYVLLYYYYGGMVYTCLHDYLRALLFFTVVCKRSWPAQDWSQLFLVSVAVCDHAHHGHQCHNGGCLQEVHTGVSSQVWQGKRLLIVFAAASRRLLDVNCCRRYHFLGTQSISWKER